MTEFKKKLNNSLELFLDIYIQLQFCSRPFSAVDQKHLALQPQALVTVQRVGTILAVSLA